LDDYFNVLFTFFNAELKPDIPLRIPLRQMKSSLIISWIKTMRLLILLRKIQKKYRTLLSELKISIDLY